MGIISIGKYPIPTLSRLTQCMIDKKNKIGNESGCGKKTKRNEMKGKKMCENNHIVFFVFFTWDVRLI